MTEGRPELIARRFRHPDGTDLAGGPKATLLGGGHVHQTWAVGDLVVQRLNGDVFADLGPMVATVVRVCTHLAERSPDGSLTPLSTTDGHHVVVDDGGGWWRSFRRVAGASPARVESVIVAGAVGRALGRFLVDVADLDPWPREAIAGFKDFEARRRAFEAAVAADGHGRLAAAADAVEAVRRHHHLVDDLAAHEADGRVPRRLVHNDAKAANVLVDPASGRPGWVIDLDTVAPGSILFDAGDLLRSTAVRVAEDGQPGAVAVDADLLRAALGGWLSAASPLLDEGERGLIPLAGPLMAYESALRFLGDHLGGDTYFRIERPGQNLRRARTQLAVLAALDAASPLVASVVAAVAAAPGDDGGR